ELLCRRALSLGEPLPQEARGAVKPEVKGAAGIHDHPVTVAKASEDGGSTGSRTQALRASRHAAYTNPGRGSRQGPAGTGHGRPLHRIVGPRGAREASSIGGSPGGLPRERRGRPRGGARPRPGG